MKKDKADIWMAWYPSDYLRDTRHLTCLEHGAYRQMIDAVFCAGGKLTISDEEILRILSISEAEWCMISEKIRRFFRIKGNTWKHSRVSEEMRKAKERKEIQRKRTEAARLQLQRNKKSVTESVTDSTKAAFNQSVTDSSSPSPSPSQCTEIERKEGAPSLDDVKTEGQMRGIPEADCVAFWNHFEASGWIDKHGHPILKWRPKLHNWRVSSVNNAAESAHHNGAPRRSGPSILDMRTMIQTKEELCASLKRRSCSDVAMGESWSSDFDKQDFFKLKREIKELRNKISSFK